MKKEVIGIQAEEKKEDVSSKRFDVLLLLSMGGPLVSEYLATIQRNSPS